MIKYQYPSKTTEIICPKCNDIVSYEDTNLEYDKDNPYPKEGCEDCGYKIDNEETYGDFIYDKWANAEAEKSYRKYITNEINEWLNKYNPNANIVLFESNTSGWMPKAVIGIKSTENFDIDFIANANPIYTSQFNMEIKINEDGGFIEMCISHHDAPTGENWRLYFVELKPENEDYKIAWDIIRGYRYITPDYFDEWKTLAIAQTAKKETGITA